MVTPGIYTSQDPKVGGGRDTPYIASRYPRQPYYPRVYSPVYTPGYTSRTSGGVPHCCCGTREGALAALKHEVAERQVRDEPLTVVPVTVTRFTVGRC